MAYNVVVARLRGFCILAVLVLHYGRVFPSVFQFLGNGEANGYYGVTAFFVVSGFLITSQIQRRFGEASQVRLGDFYIMRFARIVPMLTFTLVVLSALAFWKVRHFEIKNLHTYLELMGQVLTLRYNLFIDGPAPWTVLWSLSIEEAFYLVFPLLAIVTRSRKMLLGVLVALTVVGPVYRAAGEWRSLFSYYGCFDAIALGALTAFAATAFADKLSRLQAYLLLLAGCILLAFIYFGTDALSDYVAGPTFVAIGASAVLLASQSPSLAAIEPLRFDPFAALGNLSYELYLVHFIVLCLLQPWLSTAVTNAVLRCEIAFAAIIIPSALLNVYYSEPVKRVIRTSAHKWLASFGKRRLRSPTSPPPGE